MPSLLEIAGLTATGVLIVLPVVWAWRLALWYRRHSRVGPAAGTYRPSACVILSLRGADPSLRECLIGILNQDYPAYQVSIIVDNARDPAWVEVQKILADGYPSHVQVRVDVLRAPRETCSLKMSAILQAVEEMPDNIEIIATIDADVRPAPNWLGSLILPLEDGRIGVASGFRWFAPTDASWGTLVRYLWNAAALTQMYAFQIAWGGSLALHARVFRHPLTRQRWEQSFSEDTGTLGLVRQLGLELQFVPEVVVINVERTDLRSCCSFIRRQLFTVRFQHVLWRPWCMLNFGTVAALLGSIAFLATGLATQTWLWVSAAASLLGLYVLGLGGALVIAECCVRRIARRRGDSVPLLPSTWKLPVAGLLAQVVQVGCLLSALRLRHVVWRGITYEVEGPHRLRLLDYRPYAPSGAADRSIV